MQAAHTFISIEISRFETVPKLGRFYAIIWSSFPLSHLFYLNHSGHSISDLA